MHIISNVFFEQYILVGPDPKIQTFFNLSEMNGIAFHKFTLFVGKEKLCPHSGQLN
jgi:hypothetical protein